MDITVRFSWFKLVALKNQNAPFIHNILGVSKNILYIINPNHLSNTEVQGQYHDFCGLLGGWDPRIGSVVHHHGW